MKAWLKLEVGAYERYIIAKYFATGPKQSRVRATRTQVKRFTEAALHVMVREQAQALRGRARTTAARLAAGAPVGPAEEAIELRRPAEVQPSLL